MAKFRPSLLDTLLSGTRTGADEGVAQTESVFPGIRLYSLDRMSEAAFLDTMRRDLSWLLNTVRLEDTVAAVKQAPEVAKSVVNFGIPDFSTRTASTVNVTEASASIAGAIRTFEPRIEPKSLAVKGEKANREELHQAIIFHITCDVGHTKDSLRAGFTTEIDIETGNVQMEQRR